MCEPNYALWFYVVPKQYKEALYQNWIFSYAYFIFYNLFIAGLEINHNNNFMQETIMRNFVQDNE
jgi:hypothetical protein